MGAPSETNTGTNVAAVGANLGAGTDAVQGAGTDAGADQGACTGPNAAQGADISPDVGQGAGPRVSFIVPCYNAANTLDVALASLCCQTLESIEIIAIDDASTDCSAKILNYWAASDARIHVLTQAKNAGYGAAMNRGLEAARGQWIGILEPDDYALPSMAQSLVEAAQTFEANNPGVSIDMVKAPYVRVIHEGQSELLAQCAFRFRVQPVGQAFSFAGDTSQADQLLRNHPSIWSALYRRSFLDAAKVRFPEHPGSGWADNEFFYATLLQAKAILYVDEPIYCYNESTAAQEAEALQKQPTLALQRFLDLDNLVRQYDMRNKDVLAAHVHRAFSYVQSTLDAGVGKMAKVQALQKEVFARLDPAIVIAEASIPPQLKSAYAQQRGIKIDRTQSKLAFAQYARDEAAYMLKSNGPRFLLSRFAKALSRKPQ
ncbi:MAG: glycosyltransferase family 2 protein [Eggerthellaceae bacterium]|nr:glycosyltransferase family 2 protein [Eggerthellaceae bacterium]